MTPQGSERDSALEQSLYSLLSESQYLGSRIMWFKSLKSTNSLAKDLLKDSLVPDGMIIGARKQTDGRGMYKRRWYSPEGGVWITYILHTGYSPKKPGMLSLAAAVACAETMRTYVPDISIKWVNDILAWEKKIGGILIEQSSEYSIVGIGLNTNVPSLDMSLDDKNSLPPVRHLNLKDIATSTYIKLGHEIDNIRIIAELTNNFDMEYHHICTGKYGEIVDAYRQYCTSFGRDVEVYQRNEKMFSARAIGIDSEGFLDVEKKSGEKAKLVSEEIFYEHH